MPVSLANHFSNGHRPDVESQGRRECETQINHARGVNLGEEKSSNSTAIIAQLSISNEIRDGTWVGEGLSAGARWFAETGGMGVVRVR